YQDAPLTPRPLQQPHPPLFVAASSLDSVRWAAERGLPFAQMNSTVADVRDSVAAYRAVLADRNGALGQPGVRLFRPIYVAETTEQALAEGERAYFRFYQLFSSSDDPRYTTPSPDAWRHHTGIAMRRLGPNTFEQLDASNYLVFGDPERVRGKLASIDAEIGG